jgi:hypothetical protein
MLVLANSLGRDEVFFAPYLAAIAAVLAFSLDTGVFRLERVSGPARAVGALGLGLLGCAVILPLPWLALGALGVVPWTALVAVAAVVMAAAVVNAAIELRSSAPEERSREWTGWRFLLSFATAGAVLALQAAGWVQEWNPRWPPVP